LPSVEIICVGQDKPSDFSELPLAVASENRLKSHRSPAPLFQVDFDRLQGCIYHLGSPRLRNPDASGVYTAGDLLTEWWHIIHFKPEFVSYIRRILEDLLADSPEGRLLFTSDYQFGPSVYRYKRPIRLETFWKRHDTRRLRTNSLVQIVRG
jgi:hypothetical protein